MKKMKKFADGGELGSGMGGLRSAMDAIMESGRKKRSSVDELQDMLPSKEGVGRFMRSKLDPEILAAAGNPALYGAYKILDKNPEIISKGTETISKGINAIKNARMPELPRSYDKETGMKKGGAVKKKAKGGTVSSASKRGDGCAIKGKTKGRFV